MSEDLIEHFRLNAQIYGDHTLHTEYVSDSARGMRKAKVEKRWYKKGTLAREDLATFGWRCKRNVMG
jgi:hypothetical protein